MRIEVKLVIILPLLYVLCNGVQAQSISVEPLFPLPEVVKETSGLVLFNNKLITLNDSGNDARLFEIDPESETLERDLLVENATNGDWEGLAADEQYIYIADIGNNNGDRQNLKIYRILKSDYVQSTTNILTADSIRFNYSDQSDFESNQLTNFDAGALIVYDDSLYIFTKNRLDLHSNIYSIPKLPGNYEAKRVGRIDTKGLIAGAVYNQAADEIMLVGYDLNNAFVVRLYDYDPYHFDQGKISRLELDLPGSYQAEAIEALNSSEYFITVEGNDQGEAMLFRVSTDFVVGLGDDPGEKLVLYPNPANEKVIINLGNQEPLNYVSFFNMSGAHVYGKSISGDFRSNQVQLDLGHLPQGFYQVKINSGNTEILRKLFISKSR